MANANSTIEIELEIKQALDRLNRLERELQKSAQQMQKAADATGKLEGAMNKAKTAAAGLFAFFSGQQIVEAADQFTNFANAVRISTSSVAEQTAVQKELYRVAQTTGSSIGDISKLYGRLRQAADQLGSSQAETIKITEIVGKALAASGTSASEASGALLQLAQALNSPRVQAEEFNSLVDAMPNLLRQVERQLGITAGGLKKFVTDGQLSNKLFRDAILGSAAAIDDQFGKANDTIATALTRLNNAFILLVGNFEESTGFFNTTAAVISGLAENMDELARVLKAVAIGFAIAFAPKVIRAIRDTATAMATLGAASKTNIIGALAALGFYIADITGGLDLLTEKLGLTKDASKETADAIADLTKVGGGGVAAIAPVVPVPSQSYLQALDFMRSVISDTSMTSEQIMASLKDYSEAASAAIFDVQTKVVSGFDDIDGATIKTGQGIEEIRHIIQLFGLAYEQALGREAGESANVLALQFLAAQQAMKELLRLGEEEKRQRQEVADIIAGINLRGVETNEIEKLNRSYAAEISAIMLNTNYTLSQRVEIANALVAARDRELENVEKVLTFQQRITNELVAQLGFNSKIAKTVVSGYFGAGPNAGRAAQIGEAYATGGGGVTGLANAAFAAVLSNEKVAAAIEEQFTLLFDIIDPLIDQLALIQEAINRLIKAFLNAGQNIADSLGIGQDSYLFGGGFTKDLESFFGGGGRSRPRGPTQIGLMSLSSRDYTSETALEQLNADIDRFGAVAVQSYAIGATKILKSFADRVIEIGKEIVELGDQRDVIKAIIAEEGNWEDNPLNATLTQLSAKIYWLGEEAKEGLAAYDEFSDRVWTALNEVLIPAIRNVVDEVSDYAAPLLADFAETAGIEALATQKGISIGQARIQYINDEQLAILAAQTALAEYITDAEEQAAILAEISAATQAVNDLNEKQLQQFKTTSQEITDSAIQDIERRGIEFTNQQEIEYRYAKEIAAVQADANLTIADQVRLVGALEQARQREIDALEREADLLRLTGLQQALMDLFDDFEKGLVQIREVVDGLVQQIQDLLFSEFNLAPVRDQLSLASDTYQDLLAAALDPDATEEDIQKFQQFVETYLSSARDVFRSSTAYRNIFDQVLTDLQSLGLAYGQNAPVNLIESIQDQLRALEDQFGESLQTLIDELDRLATAFRTQSLEFDGSINVNLGKINATFDSSPFTAAINQLNIDIANAINALVATIGDASDAITDTGGGGGGTVTPTPITPTSTLSQLAASGSASAIGSYELDFLAAADRGTAEIFTSGMAQGTAADWAAAYVAEVQKAYPGQDILMDYGVFAKSADFSAFMGFSEGQMANFETYAKFFEDQGYAVEKFKPLSQSTPTPTPAPEPVAGSLTSLIAAAASGAPYTQAGFETSVDGQPVSLDDQPISVINYSAGAKSFTDAQYAKAVEDAYRSQAGRELPNAYAYAVSMRRKDIDFVRFQVFNSLTAAQKSFDTYSAIPNFYETAKYGFRQGGIVPDPMDTIPAMLSPGEYILSPETVRRFGVSSLNQLNSGDSSALAQTNDPDVKRLLAELIQAVRESETEVNVYTDMRGQAKAAVEEFRSELKERTRRQNETYLPVRYI